MKIAVVFNAHENTELVSDTIESLRTWVTDKILVVVDGAFWEGWGRDAKINAYKTCGFIHAQPRAPYKNVAYGLMSSYQLWQDADWFCYIEPDTLFCNDKFKEDLSIAAERGAWMVGTNLRHGSYKFPFLEHMLKIKLEDSKYFLGCCMFAHKKFMDRLHEMNFFEKFLFWTNEFVCPYFPDYEQQGGYDLSEHLYPTLANYMGGELYCLSSWSDELNDWRSGNFKKYPIRWQPDVLDNFYPEISIVHPVKDIFHPFRLFSKLERNKCSYIIQ